MNEDLDLVLALRPATTLPSRAAVARQRSRLDALAEKRGARRFRRRRLILQWAAAVVTVGVGGTALAVTLLRPEPLEVTTRGYGSGDPTPPSAPLRPATAADPTPRNDAEALVAEAVAPYDYDTYLSHVLVANALQQEAAADRAQCVVRLGGETGARPLPLPEPTVEIHLDFPDIERMAERGWNPHLLDPPHPEIRREDYASEDDYAMALFLAEAVYIPTEDDRELGGGPDCNSDPALVRQREVWDQFHELNISEWLRRELAAIDTSPEVSELRKGFHECAVTGGMPDDPGLNELNFWPSDGEILAITEAGGEEALDAFTRARGKLFAECGRDLYALKERMRREAHERFVAEHRQEITQLAEYLSEKGFPDIDAFVARVWGDLAQPAGD